jgi:homocitrate synthase NifV
MSDSLTTLFDIAPNFPAAVILEDTTLRDGEQMPGIAFPSEAKREIINGLRSAGVRWIEIGIPAMGGSEAVALRKFLDEFADLNLVVWNRGVRADIENSLRLGFRYIHIGLPASDILLQHSLGRDRDWLLNTARDLISIGKQAGAYVSISAEDVGRTDRSFLVEYAATIANAGADRLRLSDTVGVLTPHGYGNIVRDVARNAKVALQCHNHNDFGLGLANTLAGLAAGATFFHTTINGIGERAGLPDFAQAVMVLQHQYDVALGIRTDSLLSLSQLVSGHVGEQVSSWAPIVGRNAFRHESGIHVNALLKESSTFEPYDPARIGGRREVIIGKHSGRAAIRRLLQDEGIQATADELARCLATVREISMSRCGALSTYDVLAIFRKMTR